MADVLVLCYHAVSPTWTAELSVTPDGFERQIRYLLHHGWRPATFRDAVVNPPSAKTLAITFDDAFASVLRYAAPVLEELGACATVFAPTAFLDGRVPLEWEGIDRWLSTSSAHELAAMSWEQLGTLAERGWEIGSHTLSHPHLTGLDDQHLAHELAESRAECARRLGRPCVTIAYPYGDVDERVAAQAQRAGYVAGASLSRSLERLGPLRHPRVGIYHDDSNGRFRLKTTRASRAFRAWRFFSPHPEPGATPVMG